MAEGNISVQIWKTVIIVSIVQMCYKLTKEKLNCKLPISSRRKEKTNVLVCATFTMTKQPFILGKRCSFLLVDIGIFIDFFVLEKKKTKMCSVDRCRSSIFKKGQEKQSAKFDCPVHQIKMSKKRQDSFRVCSFYIRSKAHTERCASNKGKDEVRCQYHTRSHKRWKIWDNNIHIFHLLWGLIWKTLKGRYCEDSAWAECLKLYDKKKSSKWFCLVCQKIIAMSTDSVVCERCLKWKHLSCAFLKSYRKLILPNWFWKLVLEIMQNEVYKV